MIAVNASTSPHSSVSFTPFGSDALTLAERKSCSPFGFRPTHFITSRRQIHHSHAALSQQCSIDSPFNLNRNKNAVGVDTGTILPKCAV